MLAMAGCMPETKPAQGRMTTDPDKRLNTWSESPGADNLVGVRAGATIAPAPDRPVDVDPMTGVPTPTGVRNQPVDRPYLGNPTTRPGVYY
jgi:hypothetical protein